MKLLIYGMTEDEKKTLVEIRQQVDVEEIAFADGIFTKERIAEVDGFRAIWISGGILTVSFLLMFAEKVK